MISDKTKVSINIATLLFVIGATITGTFTIANIKSGYDTQIFDLQRRTELIEKERESDRALMLQTQTDLAEIKTDLKWIRSALEDR